MSKNGDRHLPEILAKHETMLLSEWLKEQLSAGIRRDDLMRESEMRDQSGEFLRLLRDASQGGNLTNFQASEWNNIKALLASITRTRVQQGFSPSQVALFIFSLKKPLFSLLRQECGSDGEIAAEIMSANDLIDRLGLLTTEAFQKAREEIIIRQQQEMLELSTPVVKLWEGILALPLIGTLDSARTQVVMENLLQRIVETGSAIAIIDITGVPTVDTLVAQHLLKTVAATRLMGADCIISGIRPQIAQTIVHLGVDLTAVITKATMADAFEVALKRSGYAVTSADSRPQNPL
ncbi:STAS domain-containing protein [Chlorogloea sp. CCALA 695]|uniref:STAS domain-containing protein n=1 Tax=Chlorogloea sp. CCALA 695 TaxID=2107693 RepID=UPI000D05267B|nr:STAS domain-containing protein [Chlorogloea sp. CCALA 695]PSB34235.1 anti-anti-sigma factor [Chlorogloea sp. CCALA 695]